MLAHWIGNPGTIHYWYLISRLLGRNYGHTRSEYHYYCISNYCTSLKSPSPCYYSFSGSSLVAEVEHNGYPHLLSIFFSLIIHTLRDSSIPFYPTLFLGVATRGREEKCCLMTFILFARFTTGSFFCTSPREGHSTGSKKLTESKKKVYPCEYRGSGSEGHWDHGVLAHGHTGG